MTITNVLSYGFKQAALLRQSGYHPKPCGVVTAQIVHFISLSGFVGQPQHLFIHSKHTSFIHASHPLFKFCVLVRLIVCFLTHGFTDD